MARQGGPKELAVGGICDDQARAFLRQHAAFCHQGNAGLRRRGIRLNPAWTALA